MSYKFKIILDSHKSKIILTSRRSGKSLAMHQYNLMYYQYDAHVKDYIKHISQLKINMGVC